MEESQKTTYTFKEKYFSMDKEKRIGKRQFQTRVLVPWILMIIPLMVFTGIITWALLSMKINILFASIVMWALPMLVYYGISFFFIPTLIKKRSHDFWSTGVMESRLFLWGFILFIAIVTLMLWEIFFLPEFIPLDILIQARDYVRYGVIALIIYLMLRPGQKWTNEYGEDTSNVKLWFLG